MPSKHKHTGYIAEAIIVKNHFKQERRFIKYDPQKTNSFFITLIKITH